MTDLNPTFPQVLRELSANELLHILEFGKTSLIANTSDPARMNWLLANLGDRDDGTLAIVVKATIKHIMFWSMQPAAGERREDSYLNCN